jgi:enhancing lycopene biosynthesis protein 2
MKSAVVLAGCGYLDGAEIREAVLSLLYLDQHNIHADCFASDSPQLHTMDHVAARETSETRNILTESARIARGNIQPLGTLNPETYDMLVLPGGFGVAKNYSDFALKGAQCTVSEEYANTIQAFYAAKKPIVAMCIAPAILAAALKDKHITLTIGDDPDTAAAIGALGQQHQEAATEEAIIDHAHRIITCSAYMREDRISTVAKGIEAAIKAAADMAANLQKDAA